MDCVVSLASLASLVPFLVPFVIDDAIRSRMNKGKI